MALGSTQPLTEMSKWVPGIFPGSKGGRCVRLTTLPPSCAVVTKSGYLNFLEPSGPVQACNGCFTFTLPYDNWLFGKGAWGGGGRSISHHFVNGGRPVHKLRQDSRNM
jgi:hypothetical protein